MEFAYPLQGETFNISSGYGERWGRKHKGIDLKADSGDRVVAFADGEVMKSDDTSDPNGYGGQILLKHNINGKIYYTRYAHLRKRYVTKGEKVNKGEKIGESGGGENDPNKGRSTGPHLHFELLDYGQTPIDPEPYLKGVSILGGATALSSDKDKDEDKDEDKDTTKDNDNIVDKIMDKFMTGYAPIGYLSGLKGLTSDKSETNESINEEINRIKDLMK